MRHIDLDVAVEGGLGDPPLVRGEDLRQLVGDGQVELVDRAPPEVKVVLVDDSYWINDNEPHLKKVQVDCRLGKS